MRAWAFRVVVFTVCAACRAGWAAPSLVPLPARVTWTEEGSFTLGARTAVCYAQPAAKAEAETLAQALRPATGLPLLLAPQASGSGAIILSLEAGLRDACGDEGYRLSVTPSGVQISAAAPAGLFYGGQTLRQLLPPAAFARTPQSGVAWTVPGCRIEDRPRFAWRGFMLDYARHWFTADYTKHLLDAMALHKLNVLHMHLADDEGWRIEIKKYPKLTEVGAWRGTACVLPPMRDPEGTARYGGFFTQAEIRDLVAYAARLHINLMPEVDLPGHSLALCTAYPETRPTQASGEKSVQGHAGNAISPAKEANYAMVDDIIGELATLFPFDYFHIGGDEVNHNLWKACPQIQELMAREKIGSLHDAQVYFTKRLEGILAKHHKKMIGWNEIKNDKLARTTGIMSWTGTGPGYDAARMGFPVVMAPGPHCYFDMGYPDANDEPPAHWWAGAVGTERCYAFDPLGDKGLDAEQAARILGVHAAIWTEFLQPWTSKSGWATFATIGETLDYKAFPRLCALAEMGWTPQEKRDYADFASRLGPAHLTRLITSGVTVRVPPPDAVLRKGAIEIVPPYAGAGVRYTLDGSDPFSSKSAARWDGRPVKGASGKLRARTVLCGRFSPLRAGARVEAVAKWTGATAGPAFSKAEYDLSGQLDEAGVWRLVFRKTGGKHALAVRSVELLVNGAVVAKDSHDGGTSQKSAYRLAVAAPIPTGASVKARVELKAECGADKPDTAGEVQLLKAEGLEPEASVSTTISHYQSNTPERLADWDRGTFFWSDRGVRAGESVTLTFKEPVALAGVEWVSGKLDDPTADILTSGVLEVSADGAAFRKVAEFAYGAAKAQFRREPLRAVRVTATADTGRFWVILQDPVLK